MIIPLPKYHDKIIEFYNNWYFFTAYQGDKKQHYKDAHKIRYE